MKSKKQRRIIVGVMENYPCKYCEHEFSQGYTLAEECRNCTKYDEYCEKLDRAKEEDKP